MGVQVTVESLGGLGDGIATLHGKPVFIPKSCVGDTLEIDIIRETSDKYQAAIKRIIIPGIARQIAPCPHFDTCGGCTLQQLSQPYYEEFKTRIFQNALTRAGYASPESHVVFLPAHTRRRVEFKTCHENGAFTLAFHALGSHMPVTVSQCLVLHPRLHFLIDPLAKALSSLSCAEQISAVGMTLADSGIDVVLTLAQDNAFDIASLHDICEKLTIARISVRTLETAPKIISQTAPVTMQLGSYTVPLAPASFLQATSQAQILLTHIAVEACQKAVTIIDLFCGIGTYSFPLCAMAQTHAVEGERTMVQRMQATITSQNIDTLTCEQRDLFKRPLSARELSRYEVAVLNPPRLGAKAQTEQLAYTGVQTIIMISCNPATFTRDAKILKNAGYILESAQGIDQFLWSHHLEIAAVFRKH